MIAGTRAQAEERLAASASGARNLNEAVCLARLRRCWRLSARSEAGIDTFHLQFPADDALAQMDQFGCEVLPKARHWSRDLQAVE